MSSSQESAETPSQQIQFNKKSNINYGNIVKGEGVKSDSAHTSPDLTDTS
jgi:hypothetical protein